MHFSWVASHLYFDGSGVRTRSLCRKHEQSDVTGKLLQIRLCCLNLPRGMWRAGVA